MKTYRRVYFLLGLFLRFHGGRKLSDNLTHGKNSRYTVLVLRIRVLLHKICFFVSQHQIFVHVSTVTVFENEGVSDDTSGSVFQFLVKYGV